MATTITITIDNANIGTDRKCKVSFLDYSEEFNSRQEAIQYAFAKRAYFKNNGVHAEIVRTDPKKW